MIAKPSTEDLFHRLAAPFPPDWVEWSVIETSESSHQAFVIPFVDAPYYENILNRLTPDWKHQVTVVDSVPCIQITIRGVRREGKGDLLPGDRSPEGGQKQAFIRACQSFGLGKYLQYLRGVWVDYDPEKKAILSTPSLPAWALPGGAGLPANVPGKCQGDQSKKFQSVSASTGLHAGGVDGRTSSPQVFPPKAPEHAVANAQALQAWGSLFREAKRAGISDIQVVIPPISVGDLRRRYCALRARLVQQQEKGQR